MWQAAKVMTTVLLGACGGIGAAQAADWNESLQGDLSNLRLAPTALLLDTGANLVRGAFGGGDLDYLAVSVPQGMRLSALRYGDGMVLGGVRSFVGVQAGPQMTVPPDTEAADGLLGWAHVQHAAVGTDLLPEIGRGFGASGFVGALPAGVYTFWVQDTSHEPGLAFSLNLEVSAVPEPAGAWLLLAGVGWLLRSRSQSPVWRIESLRHGP